MPEETQGWYSNDEAIVQSALCDARNLSPGARSHLMEGLRLQRTYPGEFVAYVDNWTEDQGTWHLSREVLAHAKSQEEVCRRLAELPAETQTRAKLDYEPDPHDLTVCGLG